MYKILENLATDSFGEPSELSGYLNCGIGLIDDFRIIDVKVLPEFAAPSSPSEYKLNIMSYKLFRITRESGSMLQSWNEQK